jgi:hypothetical protein
VLNASTSGQGKLNPTAMRTRELIKKSKARGDNEWVDFD